MNSLAHTGRDLHDHARLVVDSWNLEPNPIIFLQIEKSAIDGIVHLHLTVQYRGHVLNGSRPIDSLRDEKRLLQHINDQSCRLLDDLKLALEMLS